MSSMFDNEDSDVPGTHNSSSSRYGLVLCVDVDFEREIDAATEREIMSWLTLGLKDAQVHLTPSSTWHYVRGVRHDQWQDEYSYMNGLQVTVHFAQTYDDGCYWPLFQDPNPHVLVDAGDVLQHLRDPPAYVREFGVSAVPEKCIVNEWTETIGRESRTFDKSGDGYNLHIMYTLCQEPEVSVGVETSSTFGWANYPGSLGEEW